MPWGYPYFRKSPYGNFRGNLTRPLQLPTCRGMTWQPGPRGLPWESVQLSTWPGHPLLGELWGAGDPQWSLWLLQYQVMVGVHPYLYKYIYIYSYITIYHLNYTVIFIYIYIYCKYIYIYYYVSKYIYIYIYYILSILWIIYILLLYICVYIYIHIIFHDFRYHGFRTSPYGWFKHKQWG